jgi:hypothetical protein
MIQLTRSGGGSGGGSSGASGKTIGGATGGWTSCRWVLLICIRKGPGKARVKQKKHHNPSDHMICVRMPHSIPSCC